MNWHLLIDVASLNSMMACTHKNNILEHIKDSVQSAFIQQVPSLEMVHCVIMYATGNN